jgi:hypothetical protein
MKIYKVITLVGAALITLSLTSVFCYETAGDPRAQPRIDTAGVPGSSKSGMTYTSMSERVTGTLPDWHR